MLRRLFPVFLLLALCASPVWAAGAKAQGLRASEGLSPCSPPENFLSGLFTADEASPAFLFGPVRDFVASRRCPATWLMEEGERVRLSDAPDPAAPTEYTLYLEEDCGDRVVHYVFIDQSGQTPAQWLEWRRRFHKSKALPQYGEALARLERAVALGARVGGELRFLLVDGDLSDRPLEEALATDLACPPAWNLSTGAPAGR